MPFGVNVLWDPMSTVALAAATGAAFVREIFTGTYASDMGPWTPDAGAAMRYRNRLGRGDLAMLYNVSAEFADSLDRRSLPDRARSAVFSSIPDAVLVSGQITGEAAAMRIWRRSRRCCRRRRFWPIPGSSMTRSPICCGLPMAASSGRR